MQKPKLKMFTAAIAVSVAGLSSLSATTILFNDTVQHGGAFANGTIAIDSTFAFPGPGGTNTLKWTPDGSYKSGGLEFYGGKAMASSPTDTVLSFSIYVDSSGSNLMNGFTVNLDTGSFNQATDTWRLNGSPGVIGDFVGQQWNTIEVDLTSIAGFNPGTSVFNGLVTFKNNTDLSPAYIGDIRLIPIPEPSSILLPSLGGLVFLRRKRN